jgi:hypothetical protein
MVPGHLKQANKQSDEGINLNRAYFNGQDLNDKQKKHHRLTLVPKNKSNHTHATT